MKSSALRATIALGLAAAASVSIVACSGSGTPSATDKVTITVGDRPPTSQPEPRKLFDDQVAAFEKANPNITLKTSETAYDVTTFQALLAGGNIPDVFAVPFTDPQSLIKQGQIADITDALNSTGIIKELNKTTLSVGTDAAGKVYGIPSGAYSVGLVYNRDLFTKAGLDPNSPPTTWDEVRTDAKKITDATGVPGFETLATKNQGGWIFSAITYSFGGTIENSAGTKVTFNAAPAKKALDTMKTMRWTDGSIGANGLYDLDSMSQDFAAGKVGMWIAAPDVYNAAITNNKMDKNNFGVGGMPQSGGTNGTLAGGTLQVVSPKATAAEKVAAVKWINWNYVRQFENQSAALDVAKAASASGNPVGLPGLSVVSASTNAQYLQWIKGDINVPVQNFDPYVATTTKIPIMPEPVNKAQEVYAALDPIIQAVLTNKDANIDQLLSAAETSINSKLGR
jgi:ABC-type glycerol-3-phosphate transport system substrate-binding protein